ncbi:MauE/DoxX family redox-associated membrane protein [Rhodococcus aerolatus]
MLAVGLLARVGLAAVWLASGVLKAADPLQTVVAVRAYQLLPEAAVVPVADALPFVEIGLGLLLLAGVGVRLTAVASAALLVVFLVGVGSSWARGLSIDCGCFGGGGAADVGPLDYLTEIGRDLLFLAAAGWLVARPRTPFSLGPRSSTTAPRPRDGADQPDHADHPHPADLTEETP